MELSARRDAQASDIPGVRRDLRLQQGEGEMVGQKIEHLSFGERPIEHFVTPIDLDVRAILRAERGETSLDAQGSASVEQRDLWTCHRSMDIDCAIGRVRGDRCMPKAR